MIGVWLVLGAGCAYELWAELSHAETITMGVRSLPLVSRVVIAVLLVVLALHFVLSHDPLDDAEHQLHDWLERGNHP